MKTASSPTPIPAWTRWALAALLVAGAATACNFDSGDSGFSCSMGTGSITEAAVFGPFSSEPDLGDRSRDADAIGPDAGRFWVLWTNPDVEEGDNIHVTVQYTTVPGAMAGAPPMVMMDQDMAVPAADGGFVYFDPPQGGQWVGGGTLQIDFGHGGTTFGTLTFTVDPGMQRQ